MFSHIRTSSVEYVWSLSPVSLAPKPLTKPWLGFDHFPLLALPSPPSPLSHLSMLPIFLIPHCPLCLCTRSASLRFLKKTVWSPRAPNLFCILNFLCVPSSAVSRIDRAVQQSKSAGRHVPAWVPTHLVLAVNKPSDISLNCLPSNLLRGWKDDVNLSKEEW